MINYYHQREGGGDTKLFSSEVDGNNGRCHGRSSFEGSRELLFDRCRVSERRWAVVARN